ncbi:hypothetical protein BC749_109118 [Flavobacterium araucananum]|nr:hypothetical protein BC749_109118 [Flavobacterium araucananum]
MMSIQKNTKILYKLSLESIIFHKQRDSVDVIFSQIPTFEHDPIKSYTSQQTLKH